MEEIARDEAEPVARVAALDVGKAELVCRVRVRTEGSPGRRRQQVRGFATTTRSLLELRDESRMGRASRYLEEFRRAGLAPRRDRTCDQLLSRHHSTVASRLRGSLDVSTIWAGSRQKPPGIAQHLSPLVPCLAP